MDNRKRKDCYLILMLVFSAIMVAVLFSFYKKHYNIVLQPRTIRSIEYNPKTELRQEPASIILEKNKVYSQEITMCSREIAGISLFVVNREGLSKGDLIVSLVDEEKNEMIKKWQVDISEYSGSSECFLTLDNVKNVKKGDLLRVDITVNNISGEPVRLKQTYRGEKTGVFYIDGEENEELVLSYSTYNGSLNALKYFYAFMTFGMIAVICVATALVIKKARIEVIAFIVTLFLGVLYLFVIPFFSVPDEYSHFATVYGKSSIILRKEVLGDNEKVVGGEDAAVALSREEHPKAEDYVKCFRGMAGKEDEEYDAYVELRKPLNVSALGYFPQILGVTLGRFLKLNGFQVFFLGRLFALILYAVIIGLTVKLLPFGKITMFIIGILPMTLQQAVSYSYDSVMNSAIFLMTAYILYLAYSKESVEKKDIIFILLLGIVIISVKFIYFSIVGLILVIPKEKFQHLRKKIESVIMLFSGGLLYIILMKSDLILKSIGVSTSIVTSNSSTNTVDTIGYYTISYCIKHPIEIIELFIRTVSDRASFYIESMLGSWMGWLDIKVSSLVIILFSILLLFSALQKENQVVFKKNQRSILALISVLVIMEVLGSFVFYTYQGADYIWGVQGRYFLPILPITLLCMKNTFLESNRNMNYPIILSAVFLEVITIREIMSTIIYGQAIW